MVETVFLSVIIFVLVLLGIVETLYCRSQRVAGWEATYYSRRLKRRLLGLFLLLLIVLTINFNEELRLVFHGVFWNLSYLMACFVLVIVVFLLLAKDILETARFAVRKQSEIAAQSIRRMDRSMKDQSREKEENHTA